jgi:hypothetical protein
VIERRRSRRKRRRKALPLLNTQKHKMKRNKNSCATGDISGAKTLLRSNPTFVVKVKKSMQTQSARRAFQLLHVWGRCVYVETPALLAEYLVLDPAFLTLSLSRVMVSERNLQNWPLLSIR